MTACSRLGSEKTNILMRSDFAALLIASRIGLAVSSGKTIKDRDIRSPFHHDRRREQFSPLAKVKARLFMGVNNLDCHPERSAAESRDLRFAWHHHSAGN